MSDSSGERQSSEAGGDFSSSLDSDQHEENLETITALVALSESDFDLSLIFVAEITGDSTLVYHELEIELDENDIAVVNKLLPHWSKHSLVFNDWQDVDIIHVQNFANKCVAGREDVDPPYIIDENGLVFGHYFVLVDNRDGGANELMASFYESRVSSGLRAIAKGLGEIVTRSKPEMPENS